MFKPKSKLTRKIKGKEVTHANLITRFRSKGFQTNLKSVVLQEAHRLRSEIIKTFQKQGNPPGSWQKISKLTRALRKLKGKKGSKALIATATMFKSIIVKELPSGAFIGIPRSAPGSRVKLAPIHEFGVTMRATEKQRKYIMTMVGQAFKKKKQKKLKRGRGEVYFSIARKKAMVIRIPARPFMKPSLVTWSQGLDDRLKNAIKVYA